MHFLDGSRVFTDGDGKGIQSDRTAVEFVDENFQQPLVHFIKALGIDLDHRQRGVGDFSVDMAGATDLGEVANPAEQCIGDPGSSSRPRGNFERTCTFDRNFQQARRTFDDLSQFVVSVIIEAIGQPETRSKWSSQHAGARRRPDERKSWQVDLDRPRRRAGIDNDVQPEIFHRRVEILFDGRVQPVDFVDEKDVAFLNVGENPCEIARLFNLGTGRRVKLGAGPAV